MPFGLSYVGDWPAVYQAIPFHSGHRAKLYSQPPLHLAVATTGPDQYNVRGSDFLYFRLGITNLPHDSPLTLFPPRPAGSDHPGQQ